MARVETRTTKGGKVPKELKAGEPVLGAQGPDGARFLGWVLVQVWEPDRNRDGATSNGIVVNWSGDAKVLFQKASDELSKLKGSL
jgi:hypothetical protein